MEILIKGDPREIASLASQLQESCKKQPRVLEHTFGMPIPNWSDGANDGGLHRRFESDVPAESGAVDQYVAGLEVTRWTNG